MPPRKRRRKPPRRGRRRPRDPPRDWRPPHRAAQPAAPRARKRGRARVAPRVAGLARALREATERAERKAKLLGRLNEIGRRLATVLKPDELYHAIYEEMGLLMDTRNMFICLYDEARQRLFFPFYFEDGQRVPPKERALSHGLTDHVVRTRRPLLIGRDYEGTTARLGIEPFGPPAKCWMGVPMLAEGRVLGVIAIWSREAEDLYDEDLATIVQTFANQAAIAVRNAQLYEALHEREETYRAVVETAARAGEGVAIIHGGLGARTRLAYCNEEFGRITGYGREELLRMGLEDLVPPEHLARLLALEPRRAAQPGQRLESVIVAKDGAQVPIEVSAGQATIEGEPATVCFVRDITERKRAERELVELKNFTQEIVDATPVGIAYLDHRGVITYENPALLAIMGVEGPVSPTLRMNIFDHPSLAASPEVVEKLRGVLRGEPFGETVLSFRALTGKEVEIAASGVPVVRAGGVAGAILLVRDVTEARRYERALLEQRNFNQSIVEGAPIGIVYLDEGGRVTYENPYSLRISGHRPGQPILALGQRIAELPSLRAKPEFVDAVRGLLAGRPFKDVTFPYTSLYGRELVASFSGVPLTEGGRVKGAVLLFEDVTEKASLEERLKQYTERLEQVVEERTAELRAANRELEEAKRSLETIVASTADGIASLDPGGRFLFHNARFAELAGTAELRGRHLLEVLEPEDPERRAELEDALAGLRQGRPLRGLELGLRNARGEALHVVLSAHPILEEAGVGSVVATLTDITDRKRLEDELRRYTQSLEQEVERRTARLVQSAKMAALGQLVSGVAHEINNPLSYVKSNTESLLEAVRELRAGPLARALEAGGAGSEAEVAALLRSEGARFVLLEASRLLENNMKGLERISQIVLQLRNFASPQMGRRQPVDLNAAVRDTVAIFAPQFRDRVEVHEAYGELPRVPCDLGQVTQVVMNLLVNAGQAIAGKGRVSVATRASGPWAEVEVRDDGAGIPPDVLPRIFDPFFTTKGRGNTGLGLAISYTIVREHGGEILVDTELGKGTTFTVRLPLEVPRV